MDNLTLLPQPRSVTPKGGEYILEPHRLIKLEGALASSLVFAARRLQSAIQEHAGVNWALSASPLGPASETGAVLRVREGASGHPQGYTLAVGPEGIVIEASTAQGVFYGVCTLAQITQERGGTLPCLGVSDWPDFEARGLMLDVSRDKVPRMETLYLLVDMLAGWKLNQIQLYTEHTFAYRNHRDVWPEASPITGEEILALDAYCRERFIELVPNQNSFGHMHRWLTHPRYAPLAETHDEFMSPWGPMQGPFSLTPVDPGSLELVTGLFDELLPHFSSKQFNVGCDETVDLGAGRSKEECERLGKDRVYLNFLLDIYKEVTKRGHKMQFWGDIIVQSPDLVPELPKGALALEWGYEADHPFSENCPIFAASGMPFYVCPGTSAWNTIAGRTDNAVGNLLNAAENGLKYGARGYLSTDWGDNGHWQVLPVSYLGYAVGAAYSWALEANRDMDIPQTLSTHAFRDPTGNMGRAAYDLGNVYKAANNAMHNSSALFWTLMLPFEKLSERAAEEGAVDYGAAVEAIDEAAKPLAGARMALPDAALIRDEFANTVRLLRHACKRGLALQANGANSGSLAALDDDMRDIIGEYERIWLLRNRPGGLVDSAARLRKARADYKKVID